MKLKKLGRLDQAEASFNAALSLAEADWLARPGEVALLDRIIHCRDRVADVLRAGGRSTEALSVQLRRCEAVLFRAARFPADSKLAEQRLASAGLAYYLLRDLGRGAEGEPELREAIAAGLQAVAENPATFPVNPRLALGLNQFADLLANSGRTAEAIEQFDRAVELASRWSKPATDRGHVLGMIREALENSAPLCEYSGRHLDAAIRYARLIEFSDAGDRPRPARELARTIQASGDLDRGRETALLRAINDPRIAEAVREMLVMIETEATTSDSDPDLGRSEPGSSGLSRLQDPVAALSAARAVS